MGVSREIRETPGKYGRLPGNKGGPREIQESPRKYGGLDRYVTNLVSYN